MNRTSTIPISLDPSLYGTNHPRRRASDTNYARSRSITLDPAVYDPRVSRRRETADFNRALATKDLPPLPKSPWPPTLGQRRRGSNGALHSGYGSRAGLGPTRRSRSAPPQPLASIYSNTALPQNQVHSNPPSRKGTSVLLETPTRPGISPSVWAHHNASVPAEPPRLNLTNPRPPPATPASRQSKIVTAATSPAVRGSSFQTRYMNMLLSFDKIPRLHNVLSSFFVWILLVGFIVFPGTFTSLQKLRDDATARQVEIPGGIKTVRGISLLTVATLCCAVGSLGTLWLSLRWKNNYVWLLNKLYMPGALNALAGLISTLTIIYSQHGGVWSVTARAAVSIEVVTLSTCLGLFTLYNYLLLERVKQQHHEHMGGGPNSMSLKGKLMKLVRQRPVAPGSVV